MQLVADRFAVRNDRRVVDLATGGEVTLTIGSAGGASEQARWATRCDGLQKLHRRFGARLLDYGALGESQRFEAWDHSCVTPAERGTRPLDACSLSLIGSPTLGNLVEVFQFTGESRPRIVSLVGPRGAGKTTFLLALARAARLCGLVPVSVRLVRALALQDHRSLCLLDDDSRGDLWAALVEMSVRSPISHVAIATAAEELRGAHNIALPRFSPAALAAAVTPQALSDGDARRVRIAAMKARGLPGRFAQILWPASPSASRRARTAPRADLLGSAYEVAARARSLAAEQAANYEVDASAEVVPGAPGAMAAPAPARRWPVPGDLVRLRRRVAAAVALIDAGRHAPGIRELRRAIGGLARREDWTHARDGAVALGGALLRRGQPRDAQVALDAARQYCNRTGQEAGLIDGAVMYSDAWIDLARLDEAEACASSALAAARAAADLTRTAGASRALARCLFWRGQYAEAAPLLEQIRDTSMETLATACLEARVAVGRSDTPRAMECAAAAVAVANTSSARDRADAHCTTGFVHLAAGDLDAAERDVCAARSAARMARDPVRAVHARLILVEIERRRGRRGTAAAEAARLRRLHTLLPPLVRAQCRLASDVVTSDAPSEVLARHIGATGLAALALWLPADASGRTGADPLTSEVISILQICQTAEEEGRVLTQVCDRVRRHLHAAGVAWIAVRDGGEVVLASAGGRMDACVAMRAVSTGVAIAPHRSGERIEAATPVRYGGATIGGLAAR